MRILFVTPRVPYPLDKGDRLRAFHQIRELSARHAIGLFARCDEPVDDQATEVLESLCTDLTISVVRRPSAVANTACHLAKGLPAQVGYFTDQHSKRRLASMAEAFTPDVAFFQLARMGEYADAVQCPKVLDYMDCFSEGLRQREHQTSNPALSLALRAERRRMQRYERAVARKFQAFTAISQRDIDHLHCPSSVTLVANGVDLDQFSPLPKDTQPANDVPAPTDLLFVGNLEYPPNVLAIRKLIEQVLPRIQELRPSTTLRVAGKNPPLWLKRLEAADLDVCGWSDDATAWYRAATVFVAPMPVATGVQNKILQALACGTPCVTTPVAAQPLLASGAPIRSAHENDFHRTVLELLENPKLHRQVADTSRRFAQEHLPWSRSVQALEAVLEKARDGVNPLHD